MNTTGCYHCGFAFDVDDETVIALCRGCIEEIVGVLNALDVVHPDLEMGRIPLGDETVWVDAKTLRGLVAEWRVHPVTAMVLIEKNGLTIQPIDIDDADTDPDRADVAHAALHHVEEWARGGLAALLDLPPDWPVTIIPDPSGDPVAITPFDLAASLEDGTFCSADVLQMLDKAGCLRPGHPASTR